MFLKGLTMAMFIATVVPTAATAENTYIFEEKDLQLGFTAGWVAKEWRTTINGRTVREDMWGNPNKMLHGMQFGLSLSKGLIHGLGFRTGLYYEWCLSFDQQIKELGYNRFSEHSLYIPLQVMFRMSPFPNKKISITPFGGIGLNWAMAGKLKSGPMVGNNAYGYNKYTGRQYPLGFFKYGNYSPEEWNIQAEAGIAVRIKAVELSFTYAWGLNHHHLYDGVASRQNKMAVNLSVVLPREALKKSSDK